MALASGSDDTIAGALRTAATTSPTTLALVGADGTAMSYAELFEESLSVAAGLIAIGVAPGDRIGLWAPNSPEWAVAHMAVLMAGAAVVPLNTRYTIVETTDIVARAGCRIVFAANDFNGRAYAAEGAAAWPTTTVVTIGGDSPNALGMSEFADASGRRVDAETRLNQLLPDDISHVQFTSGTTGRPKGAMLRHGASVRTSRAWIANCGLVEGDRYPVVAPFSHLGGHKTGLLACLLARATAFPVAMFDVRELADMIRNHGLTFMQGPPTMFRALVELARSDGAPLSSVRVCVTGASVVPPSLVRDLRTVLGAPVVLTAYGLTESTGVCCMTRPGDDVDTVATTTGRPLPGIELRTVHPDGSDAGTDERGEVLVRGASVMAGYLDDSSATERAIRDGWLHTGDVGVLDANGRLRIVDRLTDMVVVGGLNVYPAEIEHALLDHPDVVAVAVIGIADERLGEVPAAFVVVGPAISNVDDALRTWCARRLAKFKIPRHFFATDELPVNAAGKVSKPELREQAATRVAALDATRTGAAVTATATTGSDR